MNLSKLILAALALASAHIVPAAARTAIVVHAGPPPTNFCATMCAPQYKIWDGRLSCRSGRCACGCIRPNNFGPLPRFYELY